MNQTSIYHTTVSWEGEHRGHIVMGNGPVMEFSAPPDSEVCSEVLTPEDAFVAAVNTCIMLMFLWSCERLKINLNSYKCRAEGTKMIELDRTEIFTQIRLFPEIRVNGFGVAVAKTETNINKALKLAQKYSLVANSIKSEVIINPTIEVIQ